MEKASRDKSHFLILNLEHHNVYYRYMYVHSILLPSAQKILNFPEIQLRNRFLKCGTQNDKNMKITSFSSADILSINNFLWVRLPMYRLYYHKKSCEYLLLFFFFSIKISEFES